MSRAKSIIERFPHFYRSEDYFSLFYQLIEAFGKACDGAEEDLLSAMRSHWVDTADNAGAQQFDMARQGDIDKLFTLYIESLGITSLLQQGNRHEGAQGKTEDEVYRSRIKGLINVLRNGASTKEGIVKVVAANLGILDDLPLANEIIKGINIEEFLPEPLISSYPLTPFIPFKVVNPNVRPTLVEYRIAVHADFETTLAEPSIANLNTGGFIKYNGLIKKRDELTFFSDGTALLNGVNVNTDSFLPALQPGENNLRFEAKIGLGLGVFEASLFDFSLFEQKDFKVIGQFDEPSSVFEGAGNGGALFAFTEPIADLTATIVHQHPGAFNVAIPWDIPGFTSNYKVTQHTLHQLAQHVLPSGLMEKLGELKDQEFLDTLAFFEKIRHEADSKEALADFMEALVAFLLVHPVNAKNQEQLLLRNRYKLLFSYLEYPDRFANLQVNPRSQIKPIVDKVRAAGVYAVVNYRKAFREDMSLSDNLIMEGQMKAIVENQDLGEGNFDLLSIQTPYPDGLHHELSDVLLLSGVFDYTNFNSLNAFA